MTFTLRMLFALFLSVGVVYAADPVEPDVEFPDPSTGVHAGSTVVLHKDEFYVFTQNAPGFLTVNPPGVVDIETLARPEELPKDKKVAWFRLRGTFAGGGGKVQTRSYYNAVVNVTSPVADGKAWVTFTPAGATSQAQQKTRTFEVRGMGGTVTPVPVPKDPPKMDPPPPPDPKDPPVMPPPGQVSYFFVVVRADGPADPGFTRVMGLPGWKALEAAGHRYKDYSLADATARGYVVQPVPPLPAVVTLREIETANGKRSVEVGKPRPLPSTDLEVLDLPKGVRP